MTETFITTTRPQVPPPAASATTSLPPAPDDGTCLASTIHVRPWIDAVIDDGGHDPRSRYVERFWLGVLGPTATWLLRRLAAEFDQSPHGYDIDLTDTASAMGLSYTVGRPSPFAKALQRCVMFGLAHQTSEGMAVRRRVPPIAHRHLRRMPESLQAEHETWHEAVTLDGISRAHQIAMAMVDAGDEPEMIEHQLIAVGVGTSTAADAVDNLRRLSLGAGEACGHVE